MSSKLQSVRAGSETSAKLWRTGLLTAFVYLLTLLFYIKGPQSHGRTAKELFAWFLVLSLLFLFWKGYGAVTQSNGVEDLRVMIGFACLFCLICFFIFPFHSTDVFGYINRGWQQVHYGQNPYIYRVGDIPQWQQDPMLWDHWIYNPNPYGFLFSLLCRLLALIGSGHWWLTLLLFKSVNVLAYGLTGWLVYAGARRLGQARPFRTLYLFLWNPLILMHHIANGHNDILAGCLLALSMYLAIVGAGVWIIPVLVAATLLKYGPALLLLPAFIYVWKKHGWKTAFLGCLLGALILVLSCIPYIHEWRQFRLTDIQDNATLIDNSLHSFLIHIYENIVRLIPPLKAFHKLVDTAIKAALRLGLIIFFVVQVWRLLRRDCSTRVLLEKSALIMFVLICVASSKFNAWYLGMILPPALLLEERNWLRRLVVLITCSELFSLTFFKQAYILNYFAMLLVPTWIIYRQVGRERASARGAGRHHQGSEITFSRL
jgi:hypothetical protein